MCSPLVLCEAQDASRARALLLTEITTAVTLADLDPSGQGFQEKSFSLIQSHIFTHEETDWTILLGTDRSRCSRGSLRRMPQP